MKPLTLQEFAEELWRKGDWREADFGAQIRELLNIEDEVAEPYSTLCDDIEHYCPNNETPQRALEWIGDRSNLLAEIEKLLKASGRTGDVDDEIKKLIENAPPAMEYDL